MEELLEKAGASSGWIVAGTLFTTLSAVIAAVYRDLKRRLEAAEKRADDYQAKWLNALGLVERNTSINERLVDKAIIGSERPASGEQFEARVIEVMQQVLNREREQP